VRPIQRMPSGIFSLKDFSKVKHDFGRADGTSRSLRAINRKQIPHFGSCNFIAPEALLSPQILSTSNRLVRWLLAANSLLRRRCSKEMGRQRVIYLLCEFAQAAPLRRATFPTREPSDSPNGGHTRSAKEICQFRWRRKQLRR